MNCLSSFNAREPCSGLPSMPDPFVEFFTILKPELWVHKEGVALGKDHLGSLSLGPAAGSDPESHEQP